MAIPSEDPGAILKGIVEPPATEVTLAAEAAVPTIPEAGAELVQPSVLEPLPEDPEVMAPVQVAGLGDRIMRSIGKRTIEAEKRVLPKLKDDPIQFVGNTALVRPLEQDEIDRLSTVLGGDYTKGINLPRIAEEMNLPSLGDYLARLKHANAELFEKARRGTLNFDALLQKADTPDKDATIYQWLKRAPGEGAAAEDVLAGLIAAVSLTRETQATWLKAFSQADPVLREQGVRRAAQMMAIEAELYAKISGAGSEAGRTLYMLSQVQKERGVDLRGRADQLIKMFGADSVEDLEYIGQAYLALPNPNARAMMVKQGMLANGMDMMAEAYVNSLLSSPVTHVVNMVGNTSFMMTKVAETAVAGAIGRARSAVTGNPDRVYAVESIAQIKGIIDGFTDALLVSGKTLATEEPSDIASKIDLRTRRAIGTTGNPREIYEEFRQGNYVAGAINVLGVSTRLPGRFLLAEDEFFKAVGYRMGLHAEAQRASSRMYDDAIAMGKTPADALAAAQSERLRILTDPPESTVKTIRDAAKEMTFQTDLEGALGAINEALSHPMAKLFVPFFKTPANITRAILERSPVQLVNPGFYKTLAAGGRDADVAMAKLATGSMIMGTFAYASFGTENDGAIMIHGAGPAEPSARQAFQRKGFLPYSVSIKQDDGTYKSITYSRFDPVSGLLGMAADFAYYAQHEGDGKVLDDLATAATMSIANYMMEQPLLTGFKDIVQAFALPNPRDRADKLLELFAEKVTTGGFSVLPGTGAMSALEARNQNLVQKNTMLPAEGMFGEDPTELPAFMRGFYVALQKAKARNPFFNPSLPPALNEWGETITVSDGSVWDYLSPVKIKDSKYAPVDDEIMRLGGGFEKTKKKISGVELNAEQFNRLITLTNSLDASERMPGDKGYRPETTLLPTLQQLITSPGYRDVATKEDQQAAISNYVGQYRKMARQRLLQEDPYLAAKISSQP